MICLAFTVANFLLLTTVLILLDIASVLNADQPCWPHLPSMHALYYRRPKKIQVSFLYRYFSMSCTSQEHHNECSHANSAYHPYSFPFGDPRFAFLAFDDKDPMLGPLTNLSHIDNLRTYIRGGWPYRCGAHERLTVESLRHDNTNSS